MTNSISSERKWVPLRPNEVLSETMQVVFVKCWKRNAIRPSF